MSHVDSFEKPSRAWEDCGDVDHGVVDTFPVLVSLSVQLS